MKELRDKLFEIELQIKFAKLEQNEQKISQLLEEKDQNTEKLLQGTNFSKVVEMCMFLY